MENTKTPMKWGRNVEGVEMSRMVVGLGQKSFKLEEMTAEDVAFWESKGVDFSFYKVKEAKEDAKPAKQTKEERFKMRVDQLLALGFERVEKNFTRGEDKVSVKEVESAGVEKFAEILEGFKTEEPENTTTTEEGAGE